MFKTKIALSIPLQNQALLNISKQNEYPQSFVFWNHYLPENLGVYYFFKYWASKKSSLCHPNSFIGFSAEPRGRRYTYGWVNSKMARWRVDGTSLKFSYFWKPFRFHVSSQRISKLSIVTTSHKKYTSEWQNQQSNRIYRVELRERMMLWIF